MDRNSMMKRKSSIPVPSSTTKKTRPSSSNYGSRSTRKSALPTPGSSRQSFSSRPSLIPMKNIKDLRQLDNHTIRKKEVYNLYNFLVHIGFSYDKFSVERFNPPPTSTYIVVFRFLAKFLSPEWNPAEKKPEEQMLNFLKTLGYPYVILRSHLANVVPCTWPQALGALVWLAKVVQYSQDCVPKVIDFLQSDPMQKIKQFFFRRCYEEFMDHNDGPYLEIESEVQAEIDEINREANDLINMKKNEIEMTENACHKKQEEKDRHDGIVKTIEDYKQKMTKLVVYTQDVEKYIGRNKGKKEKLDAELEELKKERTIVLKDIAQMKSTVSLQKYSQADIERKQSELESWEDQIRETDTKNEALDKELSSVLAQLHKEKQKYSEMIYRTNEEIRSVLHDEDIKQEENVELKDYLLDQNDDQDLMTAKHLVIEKITPLFNKIQNKLVEECTKTAQEESEIDDKLSHAEHRESEFRELQKKLKEDNLQLEAKLEEYETNHEEIEQDQELGVGKIEMDLTQLKISEENVDSEIDEIQKEIEKLKKENAEIDATNEREIDALFTAREAEWEKLEDTFEVKKKELQQAVEARKEKSKKLIQEVDAKTEELLKVEKQIEKIRENFEQQELQNDSG